MSNEINAQSGEQRADEQFESKEDAMSSSNTGMEPNRGDPDDVGQRRDAGPPAAGRQPPATGQVWSDPEVARLRARRRSPVFAGLLSLCPGLGQIYVGHYQRGFTNLVVIAMTIAFMSWAKPVPLDIIGGFFVSFYWLYNIIDAIRLANFYNEAQAGASTVDLEKHAILPSRGGSVFGGIALIAVGFLLILHTVFELSLVWMERWWPLIPVVFGVYLIYRGVQERKG